ncbi:cysteine proteinase B isoform 2-T2 [Clarias gariepinus]
MQYTDAFTVVLSYTFLVLNVSHGAVARLSVELHNTTEGEITELLNQLFNRSYYTQADYLQAWINLQDSVKRQMFLNTHSKDVKHAAVYGVNQFSVLSTQQFKDLYLRAHPHKVSKYRFFQDGRLGAPVYPRKFDWRGHGAVGPVHDQKSCGACWAFSVVSAIESVRVKDGGTFQSLSVQQVLDCAYESKGCFGGSPVTTLDWLKQREAGERDGVPVQSGERSVSGFLSESRRCVGEGLHCLRLQWTGAGDDQEVGGLGAVGGCGERTELAGLFGRNHSAPLLFWAR